MANRKPTSSAQYVSNYFSEVWFCEMIHNFYLCHSLLAARCQNNSASEEETEVLEEANKVALMTNVMESLRDSVYMKGLIERMFDYKRDLALVESEIFGQPDRMDVGFNYIDLTFQLFPILSDKA